MATLDVVLISDTPSVTKYKQIATVNSGHVIRLSQCTVAQLPNSSLGDASVVWCSDAVTPAGTGAFLWKLSSGAWVNAFGGVPNTTLDYTALPVVTIAGAQTIVGAKTFSGALTTSNAIYQNGVTTLATFTSGSANLTIDTISSIYKLSATVGLCTFGGMTNGATGRVVTLINVGNNDIVLTHQNAGTTAANRFTLGDDYVLSPQSAVTLTYDTSWRVLNGARTNTSTRSARIFEDFLGNISNVTPTTAIAGGSAALVTTADINHVGVMRIISSALANSGARCQSRELFYLRGGTQYASSLRLPSQSATQTVRAGFFDGTATTETDGLYFQFVNGAVSVVLISNAVVVSTTAMSTVLSIGIWYTFQIDAFVANGATAGTAVCTIRDFSNAVLETVSVVVSGIINNTRMFGAGVYGLNSAAVSAQLAEIDYIDASTGNRSPLAR